MNTKKFPIWILLPSLFFGVIDHFYGETVKANKAYGYGTVVELSGVIVEKKGYGPPGYGESPKTDEKVDLDFLKLSTPIDVIGSHKPKTFDSTDYPDVREIQLFADSSFIKKNKKVILKKVVLVKGTLYERDKGWEKTDVIMLIDSIKLKK